MTAYESYARAFGRDLGKHAVWPGTSVDLGDYGEIQNRRWTRLGSIWNLIPRQTSGEDSQQVAQMKLGDANTVKASAGGSFEATGTASASAEIEFGAAGSLFVAASRCKTRSLKNLQNIVVALVRSGKWNGDWCLVSELFVAEKFQVVISSERGLKAKVQAKTSEILQSFLSGKAGGQADLEVSGEGITFYESESGPVYMTLVRADKTLFGEAKAKPARMFYADDDSDNDTNYSVVEPLEVLDG